MSREQYKTNRPEPKYDATRPVPKPELVFSHALPNSPGMSQIGLKVSFAPNSHFPPHTHNGASVHGYVMTGTVLNKMNEEPMEVIPAGGAWFEAPGCHHVLSANASETEPATILATMIIDTKIVEEQGQDGLVIVDEEYKELLGQAFQKYGHGNL